MSASAGKWRNWFFAFGIVAIAVMLFTFRGDWQQVRDVLGRAGIVFPIIVLLWIPIYIMNAGAWQLIIRDGVSPKVPFLRVLKLSITGFALNYTTPFGLMGGEPYRILELSRYVGVTKATSSVTLYVMMHIFSHFCFWLSAVVLYLVLHFIGLERYPLDAGMIVLLAVLTAVFLFVGWLFLLGYRRGVAMKLMGLLCHVPLVRRWASDFIEKHKEKLIETDAQIAALHSQRKGAFWGSLGLEYAARIVGCVEYWLLIGLLMPDVTFWDSVLIMAFSSLFSNLLFFLPMQLGSREGGLAIAASGISIPGSYGFYTSLMTRVREFIWIVIGIGLMKIGNGKTDKGAAV